MDDLREALEGGRNLIRSNWGSLDFDHTEQALGAPPPEKFKSLPEGATVVDLMPKEKWSVAGPPLIEALLSRESRRKYSPAPYSLEELSILLYCTQGIKRMSPKSSFRPVPSAGARHGFETYVYADRVEGLEKGLYRYLPDSHRLCLVAAHRGGMEKDLDAALLRQLYGSAAVFAWTAIPHRMEWRYSTASAKLLALDAGHLCQNLYLACEAIGAGACAIGAYDQSLMDHFLGVDGDQEFAIYCATSGKL